MRRDDGIKKKKMLIENLEKRMSTSPLLVQTKSAEGMGMLDRLKSMVGANPMEKGIKAAAKNNTMNVKDIKLSNDKFISRLEGKHKSLSNMSQDKKALLGKMSENKSNISHASDKFLNRIEKKHRFLSGMAQDKKELSGKIAGVRDGHSQGSDSFLNRIEQKHRNLAHMAAGGKRKHLHHRPHHIDIGIERAKEWKCPQWLKKWMHQFPGYPAS